MTAEDVKKVAEYEYDPAYKYQFHRLRKAFTLFLKKCYNYDQGTIYAYPLYKAISTKRDTICNPLEYGTYYVCGRIAEYATAHDIPLPPLPTQPDATEPSVKDQYWFDTWNLPEKPARPQVKRTKELEEKVSYRYTYRFPDDIKPMIKAVYDSVTGKDVDKYTLNKAITVLQEKYNLTSIPECRVFAMIGEDGAQNAMAPNFYSHIGEKGFVLDILLKLIENKILFVSDDELYRINQNIGNVKEYKS